MNRDRLRGSRLDPECYGCHTIWESTYDQDWYMHSAHFCYGIMDMMTEEKTERCQNCKAHVDYVDEWEQKIKEYKRKTGDQIEN